MGKFSVVHSRDGYYVDDVQVIDEDGYLAQDVIEQAAGDIADGTTLEVDETNGLQIKDGGVGSTQLADSAVNSNKLSETVLKTDEIVITSAMIVGTDAGDIGHSGGAILLEAPGAGYVIEFVSAVLAYKYSTAAYTGGGDDLVIRQGTTAVSAPIAKADLLADTASDIAYVNALSAADIKLTDNSTLNLYGTAYTNPGTAAGTLSVFLTYKVHYAYPAA